MPRQSGDDEHRGLDSGGSQLPAGPDSGVVAAPTWQEELRAAVRRVVLSKGRPASNRPDPEDWRDPWLYGTQHRNWEEIAEHRKHCEFSPTGPVQPVQWSEFHDTDQPNYDKHGLIAVCSCACGKYTDVTWLYQGTLDQVIRDLLNAAALS